MSNYKKAKCCLFKIFFCKFNLILIFSLFTLIFLNQNIALSQNYQLTDTLKTANNLRNQGKLKEAINLLKPYYEKHPTNLQTIRLYSGTLYWMKKFKEAGNVFKKAIKYYPEKVDLKIEYAEMLVAINKLHEAKIIISQILKEGKTNVRIEILIATMKYYQKKYYSARKHLKNALKIDPYNKAASDFLVAINRLISPWLILNTSYLEDSQPLEKIAPNIQAGFYISPLVYLNFDFGYEKYKSNFQTYDLLNFQIKNISDFNNIRLRTELAAGIISYSVKNTLNYTWKIGLYKKLSKHLTLGLKAERLAYTYSALSLDELILRESYTAFFELNQPKKWNAKTAFNIQKFPDNNFIKTFYAWVLFPSIKLSNLEINLGYAFNYSDSEKNCFTSTLTTDEILAITNLDIKISGVFNPYFTPNNQINHSALFNVLIKPSKNFIFKFNSAIGVYSKILNPGLYIEKNKLEETVLIKDYNQTSYIPLNLSSSINYNLSKNFTLNVEYNYLHTYYFHSNNYNVGVKIKF